MKQSLDTHCFRERNASKELQAKAFNTSQYLSAKDRIERALAQGQIYETDKFYTKKKFIFREPQPLKQAPSPFKLTASTEVDRVNETISGSTRLDNGCFNANLLVQPDVHRLAETKDKWLSPKNFAVSP